ncbi:MAG: hypothetical protein H0V82_06175 [Candidatus Protochlamydia sp.]|nr:hypothetical protein [Candidatus Protochlamydia sp.]
MIIEQWKEWNQQGLIPGPDEGEADWKSRIAYCLQLKKELAVMMEKNFPFCEAEAGNAAEGIAITEPLYDLSPEWVPIFYNNFQLAPWHGGCAWIFQLNEQTPTAAFLQLRSCFRFKNKFLFFYTRQELIAHELAHIGRMMFEEPIFEEILAYRTSASKGRQWLGPIVQSSKESLFFLGSLAMITMVNLAFMVLNQPFPMHISLALWLFPMTLLFMAFIRLGRRQLIFKRCCQQIKIILSASQKAHALAYRLSDQEIFLFSSSSSSAILSYISEQKSFRWTFLKAVYLSDI